MRAITIGGEVNRTVILPLKLVFSDLIIVVCKNSI